MNAEICGTWLARLAVAHVTISVPDTAHSRAGSLPQGDLCLLREEDQKIAAFGSSYGGRVSRVSSFASGGASWLRSNT